MDKNKPFERVEDNYARRYIDACIKYGEEHKHVSVPISIIATEEDLVDRLESNVKVMTRKQWQDFIEMHYARILSLFESDNIDWSKLSIMYCENFLMAWIQFLSQKTINQQDSIIINRIYLGFVCYFNSLEKNNGNDYIIRKLYPLYFGLAKIVNAKLAISLLGAGFNEDEAVNLAACRYSNEDSKVVCMLNSTLYSYLKNNNSKYSYRGQLSNSYIIERVYDLFTSENVSLKCSLFINSMMNPISMDQNDTVNNDMNVSLLAMLNKLPTNNIMEILTNYSRSCIYYHGNVRFSMFNLQSFPRIMNCVYTLRCQGIFIP